MRLGRRASSAGHGGAWQGCSLCLQHHPSRQLEAPSLKAQEPICKELPLHPIWLHCNQGPLPGPGRPSFGRGGVRCLPFHISLNLDSPAIAQVSRGLECHYQSSSGWEKCRVPSQQMPSMTLPFRDQQGSGSPGASSLLGAAVAPPAQWQEHP